MVSFCNAYWGAALNPIAMMKRDANFANACGQHPENFILCEKYTSKNGFLIRRVPASVLIYRDSLDSMVSVLTNVDGRRD